MAKSTAESLTEVVVDLPEKALIRVLHVDDETSFLKVAKRCLEMEGTFQVDTASSVEEALEKMTKKTFDVIVSDYMMPEKDGLEFLKELRKKEDNIPFIMFTGKGREEVAINALNFGADQYLNKIGDPETVYGELAHGIRQVVEKNKVSIKLRQSLENIRRRSDELATLMESSTKMMRTSDLGQRLKVIAEAIRKIGWRRVVITVRDKNLEITDLVTEGLTKEEVKILLERKSPGNVWRERLGPKFNRFKIGEFYYLPWSDSWVREKVHGLPSDASSEEVTTYAGVPSKISPEEMVDWHPQDLLYAPLRLPDGRIVGIISIDDPLDGRRPRKDSLIPLELFLYQAAVAIENAQLMHARIERKKAEEALRESEVRYRRLFEKALDAIFVADAETGILIDCNRAASELVGREKSELVGKHQAILHPPEEITGKFSRTFKQHRKEKEGYVLETKVITKKGEIKDVAIKANIFKLRGKKVVQGIFRDITERKQFEKRLSALNTYSRDLNMAENMEEIYRLTLDAMEKTLGFEQASFMVVDENVLCVADQRGYPEIFSLKLPLNGTKGGITVKAAKTGKPVLVPDTRKERDYVEGMPNIRSELAVPIKIGDRVLGVLNVENKRLDAFDEKDQKLLEILASHAATAMSNLEYAKNLEMYTREIKESQEKFERLFMNNPEAADFLDPTFHIMDVNPRFEELFGCSLDEVKGKHINDIIVPKNKMEEAKMLDKKAGERIVYYDTVRKRKDGSLVQVSISAAPIIVEGKLIGTVGLYKDITERKKAEEELEESRRHFQTLFNVMVDPVVIVDGKGKFLEITDKVEEITGFKKEELLGKNFFRTKIVTAKSKAILIKNLAKRMIGMHIPPYEVEVITKDGKRLPYEVNAAKIEYKGKTADLVAFRDISERKKMEEKLRVVGRLTRHDVRNKLSAVTGNVFLAKRRLSGDHEALEYLGEIESACRQVERIFDFAKTYERLGVEELVYMDVEKTFEEAISLFSDLHGTKVVNDCHGLIVLADSLLRQLFYNLIDNSLKHGQKVSQIRVYYEGIGKDYLRLIYEDNGIGIPKAEKEKIFKEGYGKHTGYGLYLIRKICEVYGWTIRETGKPNKGAQFTITIPRMNENSKENYQLH